MKIWYSIFSPKAFISNDPAFYSSDFFLWKDILESNWLKIKSELDTQLTSNPRLKKRSKKQKVNYHGSWKTMPLMTWGVKFHKNINNFPVTITILNQIPGLVSASFNLLEKNAEIKPHFGETNASFRVHLGLIVPGKLPDVGINVKDVSKSWEEGKILVFCDGFEHSAWNHSNNDRYILLLDIIKPELDHKKKMICGNVLASLFLQSVTNKINFLNPVFLIPIYMIHFISKIFAIILTPLYNLINKLIFNKKLG